MKIYQVTYKIDSSSYFQHWRRAAIYSINSMSVCVFNDKNKSKFFSKIAKPLTEILSLSHYRNQSERLFT